MNRNKVITESISFNEFKRIKTVPKHISPKQRSRKIVDTNIPIEGDITLHDIIKFSKDTKNVKSNTKRKNLTKNMLIEYLEMKYAESEF